MAMLRELKGLEAQCALRTRLMSDNLPEVKQMRLFRHDRQARSRGVTGRPTGRLGYLSRTPDVEVAASRRGPRAATTAAASAASPAAKRNTGRKVRPP